MGIIASLVIFSHFSRVSLLFHIPQLYCSPANLLLLLQRCVTAGTNREMPEFIINAYKHGSFGKIQEFTEFQEKVQWSLQSWATSSEAVHMLVREDPKDIYIPDEISGM